MPRRGRMTPEYFPRMRRGGVVHVVITPAPRSCVTTLCGRLATGDDWTQTSARQTCPACTEALRRQSESLRHSDVGGGGGGDGGRERRARLAELEWLCVDGG